MLDRKIRWVLRNARQHAAAPELRTAAGFAAGAGRAPAVHRAQVGRWENGGAEISYDLVRRYETVLCLPEGTLLRAIDYLSRDEQPLRTTPTLTSRSQPDVDESLALLERALSTERMAGLDWDQLSGNLSRMPHAMIRARDWEALMQRCILEMTAVVGLEYGHREEAIARLAGHPRSGPIVVEMARELLADSSTAVYSDSATLLAYSRDNGVAPLLLEHITNPTNGDSLRAALFAMTMVASAGRLSPDQATQAGRLALSVVRDDLPFYVHRAAANLLRVLDPPHRHRLASVLTADDRRHVALILMEGRVLGLDAAAALKRRLVASLVESLGPVDTRDAVLQELLDTALGSTEEYARSSALAILMLSPQSRPVGLAYAAELARARSWGDDVAAVECLSVLTWLVQPESLDQLTAGALDPGLPAEQAMLHGVAVGNAQEPMGPARVAREAALEQRARTLVADAAPTEQQEQVRQRLRGLVYALGIRGRFDLLTALSTAVHPHHPHVEVCRGVLRWWLDLPAHVRPASS